MTTKLIPADAGVTVEQIANAESALGKRLPNELRSLLKQTNGARTEPDWFVVEWITEDIPELVQLHYFFPLETIVKEGQALAARLPANALAFGQDPGGALLLIVTDGADCGAIQFWKLAYDAYGEGDNTHGVGVVASSLRELIDAMEPEPDFG